MLQQFLCAASLLVLLSSVSANAQSACLGSFAITLKKKDQPIANYLWLPGYNSNAGSLTCGSAEAIRANLYVHNREAIEAAVSADRAKYVAILQGAIESLEQKIAELRSKISINETAAALQMAAEVVQYELTKAATLIACFAPDVSVSKFACAAGLIKSGLDTVKLTTGQMTKNQFKDVADRSEQELASLKKSLAEMRANLKDNDMPALKGHAVTLFSGLCTTIKAECL